MLLCLFIHLLLSTPSTSFSNFKGFLWQAAVVQQQNTRLIILSSKTQVQLLLQALGEIFRLIVKYDKMSFGISPQCHQNFEHKTEVYFFKGLPRATLLCLFIHLLLSTPSTFFSNFKTFFGEQQRHSGRILASSFQGRGFESISRCC